jgi:hypothetical protein
MSNSINNTDINKLVQVTAVTKAFNSSHAVSRADTLSMKVCAALVEQC